MTKYKIGDKFVDIYANGSELTIVRVDTADPFTKHNPCYECRLWSGNYSPGVAVKFETELDKFYVKK